METVFYESIEEFCDEIDYIYEDIEDNTIPVLVIAKYDEAKEIVSELCALGHKINGVNISSCEWNRYSDEYVISLTEYGLFCDPLKNKDKYLCCEGVYTFIFGDCNSKSLKNIKSKYVKEVEIGCDYIDDDYDDYDDDYDDYDYGLDSLESFPSDDLHGFTVNKSNGDNYSSISFYSTEKYNAKEIEELMELFGL